MIGACRFIWSAVLEVQQLRASLLQQATLLADSPPTFTIADLADVNSHAPTSWLQDLCATAPHRRPPLGLRTAPQATITAPDAAQQERLRAPEVPEHYPTEADKFDASNASQQVPAISCMNDTHVSLGGAHSSTSSGVRPHAEACQSLSCLRPAASV